MTYYLKQLSAADIETYIDPWEWTNDLEFQLKTQRPLVNKFSDYSKIVFTDAFDVLFFGTKVDLLSKIPDTGVITAAERIYWPDDGRAADFPCTTAWRYVNGGMMAGTPQSFSTWLDGLESHPVYAEMTKDYNQRFLNRLRVEDSPLMTLDEKTEIFYCLPGEKDELSFEKGRPVNKVCGTHPNFLHINNPPTWNQIDNPEFWSHVPFSKGWMGEWRATRWQ